MFGGGGEKSDQKKAVKAGRQLAGGRAFQSLSLSIWGIGHLWFCQWLKRKAAQAHMDSC